MKLTSLQLARYLFLFTAVVLIVFGVGSLLRINENSNRAGLYAFYAALMFFDALLMAFCAFQLPKRSKWIFNFSAFVLVLNILLTIFDQFGVVDLLFVLLNAAAFALLVLTRKEFLPA